MGSRVAKNLVAREFTDWIELSDDYSLVEAAVPQNWIGRCLAELKVRERFGINVVGIILDGEVDYLPEQAFLNVGTIEDAIKKGEKLLAAAKG
jgi:Trk K+ transport system NAD-binding subunit